MDTNVSISGLAPFSLKDAPALIERVFPAQKIGIESQKERKAGAGQTLTALGSYWKGRKPLVLVRATVLASLLPATDDPEADLEVFDLLMRMDADGMWLRQPKVTATHILDCPNIDPMDKLAHLSRSVPRLGEKKESETGSFVATKWLPIDLSYILNKRDRDEERARIENERGILKCRAFNSMPFSQKVSICKRIEEVEDLADTDHPFYRGIWALVNSYV